MRCRRRRGVLPLVRSPSLPTALALAARAGGVVTTGQLIEAGCSPRLGDRQVRAGHWQRPARGVYVPHRQQLTGLELGRAARVLAGDRVVVSGLVAARELGLRWIPPSDRCLALVEPTVRTPSSGRIVLRRTTDLAQVPTWWRGGVELAGAQRAVVDAARGVSSLRDVRGIVLGAVADGWSDVATLRDVLDRTQRNGSGLTRRALLDAERGCASPPEAELVDALVGRGVPFYVNPELRMDGRLLGLPDIWLPGLGTGGEVDSVERHGSAMDVESTYDRHERITGVGLDLVHLSVRRIRRDADEAACSLLQRARQRRGVEPQGLVVVPRGPLLR